MVDKSLVSRVDNSLKNQFGVTISNASKRQVYEALMRSVRDILMEKKFSYEQTLKQTRQKRAYYMSMEFLVGRTLRNNLFNLGLESEAKNYLKENNFSLIPRLDSKISFNILAIGFSSFIIEFSDAILISVLNHLLLPVGGNDAIILVGVITKVSMFMFVAMIGVSSSIQPLISYNYGAKNFVKIKKILKTGFVFVFSLSTLIWIFMNYKVKFIIGLFLKDERLLQMATDSFKYVILVFPILSFYYICIYFFQSVGKEKYNFFLSIYRETLLYIPIVIIMVGRFGVLGAWISYPIVDFISAVTGFILLLKTVKKISTF